jgi:hypothetical protein
MVGGPTIRLNGQWLASAQQAATLEAASSGLHAQIAARDASNFALAARCRELEAEAARAKGELAAAADSVAELNDAVAQSRASAREHKVERDTLALDLPIFESKHDVMLRHFSVLQQRVLQAEHARYARARWRDCAKLRETARGCVVALCRACVLTTPLSRACCVPAAALLLLDPRVASSPRWGMWRLQPSSSG